MNAFLSMRKTFLTPFSPSLLKLGKAVNSHDNSMALQSLFSNVLIRSRENACVWLTGITGFHGTNHFPRLDTCTQLFSLFTLLLPHSENFPRLHDCRLGFVSLSDGRALTSPPHQSWGFVATFDWDYHVSFREWILDACKDTGKTQVSPVNPNRPFLKTQCTTKFAWFYLAASLPEHRLTFEQWKT